MSDPSPAEDGLLSAGTLLDGHVAYTQRTDGYRTGIEPVLLAAFIPAAQGDRVVEAGTGAGAGLLCLAARVPGLTGIGLEIDPVLAALAAANLVANRHPPGPPGLCIQTLDVTAWRPTEVYDHAFANPPWHQASGTQSSCAGRRLAKVAAPDVLTAWTASLAAGLRHRGTLSLLLPAADLARGVVALRAAGCPEIVILPLWPRAGVESRLVILRGVRSGRGAGRLLAGLTLHHDDGTFTAAADSVLRGGGPL